MWNEKPRDAPQISECIGVVDTMAKESFPIHLQQSFNNFRRNHENFFHHPTKILMKESLN